MPKSVDPELAAGVFTAALTQLEDIRKGQIASLLPFSLAFGFNVIPSTTAPSPTILLPPEDYKLFEAAYHGPEGDAVRSMLSAAAPAQPPKGAAPDAGDPASPLPPVSEVPGEHILYKTGDVRVPSSILDANGDVVLRLCKICGLAEGDLDDPAPCGDLDRE